MRRRSLLTCLATACLALAGLVGYAMPASAEEHVYTVVLVNGNTLPLTLDEPANTPLDQITLPEEFADFIYSVSDGTTTVLAKDLQRTPEDPSDDSGAADASSDPGLGSAIKKSRPKAKDETSGTGAAIAPDKSDQKKADESQDAGKPDPDNPTYSFALPGPAPVGVPNFFIDRFRIPPFLLPIYQAAGTEYGVRWEVLAAINEIETDYGRNLNVSSAGAEGWMQFLPSTWKQYGVDANNDGKKDPYNPVDAIFAAARYLRAAGGDKDIKKGIYAYNHADWYVDSVMLRAKVIAGMPTDLIGSLTGLTEGRFPVDATSTYADAITASDAEKKVQPGQNAADPDGGDSKRKSIKIFADSGSKVIAVHDGKILDIGENDELGKFIKLRDVYGNTYTYAHLGSIEPTHEVPVESQVTDAATTEDEQAPPKDPAPTTAASDDATVKPQDSAAKNVVSKADAEDDQRRIFANPGNGDIKPSDAGSSAQKAADSGDDSSDSKDAVDVATKPLEQGSTVTAGTLLGKIGKTTKLAPNLEFSITPAGRGAPKIDPKPILDGWKLLETTAIYRAADKNPFVGDDASQPTIGQMLLMSKETLSDRVLNDPRIKIYDCGRQDIKAGIIDRRVLATLEFLTISGYEPTVSSLRCGHSRLTTTGNVSFHASGNAVDISAVNGTPIVGHQGPGSITDQTVRKLLTLQGAMKPDEIITLAQYAGTDNTFAMADHYNHIHVGFRPLSDPKDKTLNAALKPGQWSRLMDRLGQIQNPTVGATPSEFSISATAKPKHGAASKHGD